MLCAMCELVLGSEWNDEQCNNHHGYVCKKPQDGSYTTEATTPFPSGHCPQVQILCRYYRYLRPKE